VQTAEKLGVSGIATAVGRRDHLIRRSDTRASREGSPSAGGHHRSGEITIIEAMLYAGTLLAGLFLAGLAISAIAAGGTECTNTNSTTTICQNPGNTQVSTSPGVTANNYPYWWGWPWGGSGITISIGGGGWGRR